MAIAELLRMFNDKPAAAAIERRGLIQQMGNELNGDTPSSTDGSPQTHEAKSTANELVEKKLLSRKEADERLRRFAELLNKQKQ